MHITMVKKRLADGSECRKCQEASDHLQSRGLWDRIDEVVWAEEGNHASPGMQLGSKLGVDRAPFFVVRETAGGQAVYVSVLQLVKERLGQAVTVQEQAQAIDPDDIGGI
jgi:hypothetical protein